MEKSSFKNYGISLLVGTVLIVITMGLHPVGGNISHLLKVSGLIKITHGIAIFAVPFVAFGFYGLNKKLSKKSEWAVLAFMFMLFSLIAVMLAGIINGLALPFFIHKYSTIAEPASTNFKMIIDYGFMLNKSFDYVFITGCSFAILINSILMMMASKFEKTIAYLGVFIILMVVIDLLSGFIFTGLFGFRVFTLAIALWILGVGISLTKQEQKDI